MGGEVKVGPVGHPLQLTKLTGGKTEAVFDIDGALGVVGELFFRVLVEAKIVGVDT